jgi:hypothetical protein
MKSGLLLSWIGAGLLSTSLLSAAEPRKQPPMSDEMRRAIEFEHYKDVAAQRQARKEARHPGVSDSNADRSADRDLESTRGNPVKDPGPPPKKQNH